LIKQAIESCPDDKSIVDGIMFETLRMGKIVQGYESSDNGSSESEGIADRHGGVPHMPIFGTIVRTGKLKGTIGGAFF
jgi:hypothetical protein